MSKVAVCTTVRFAASGRIFCPRFATSEQERRCTAPEGRGPGWPEFHAPSDVGVSTASVASTNLGQNLSAIIPQTGEISGLGGPPGDSCAEQVGFYGSILPAAWSLMLALRARGLGSTWTSLLAARQEEVREILSMPDDAVLTVMLPVAHMKGAKLRRAERLKAHQVCYQDRWLGDHQA